MNEITVTNCIFKIPLNNMGEIPTPASQPWSYSQKDCFSTTTIQYTQNASTTDINILYTFSSGEIVISVFILFLIVIKLASIVTNGLQNVNTKKTFLRYKDSDTEISQE